LKRTLLFGFVYRIENKENGKFYIGQKKIIKVEKMTDTEGNPMEDAMLVQQRVRIYTDLDLQPEDILRKKNS
jgi:hypothetical protein